jgi:hypothetical protein
MNQRKMWVVLGVLVVLVALALYVSKGMKEAATGGHATAVLPEQPVKQIELAGVAADRKAEFSGLAWYGDNLILLPQYPNVFDETGDGKLFYLPKKEIMAYVDGTSQTPLEPRPIQLVAPGLAEGIPAYQGFESIGFAGNQAFLTIESGEGTDMMGHIISGEISSDLSTLTLDTSNVVDIQPQAVSANHTDESLLVMKDKVLTFYEVDGEKIVAEPVAHVFDFNLKPLGTIPMTNLEYRLTDTSLASGNEFWGINYFFPGDSDLAPATDPIADKFGKGESQNNFAQIERLVKFEYSDAGATLADTAPVSLVLTSEDARNWEGLVVLDDQGFLLATDKYPSTILAFVPMPK